MNYRSFIRVITLCHFLHLSLTAQIHILNISIQPFNVTPEALLNVNIMNGGEAKRGRLVTQLFNSGNAVLLTVSSNAFEIRNGLNSGNQGQRSVAMAQFSNLQQANYLKTTHNLPGGRYKVCSSIIVENGPDKADEFCDEIEADFNQYLYLIVPFDGDTVESEHPILSWTHSEPFSILNQGEYYRMVVAELKKDQSPEEAVTINSPVMMKNYLQEHQLQYPYDAAELKAGKRYAWQVQKLADGIVINKTEAWMFIMKNTIAPKSAKYVSVKRHLDGSYYVAHSGIVYFRFSEEYKSQGALRFGLRNEKGQPVEVSLGNQNPDAKKDVAAAVKTSGNNLYELDMDENRLSSGFYTLEIKNEKEESFYLKIQLP